MKNKGFTLIELLAVIIVLSIIVVLTIPNVVKTMDKAKDEAMITYSKKLIKGAMEYAVTHQEELVQYPDEYIDVWGFPEVLRGTKAITFFNDDEYKDFEKLTSENSNYIGSIGIFDNKYYSIFISEEDYDRCLYYNNIKEESKKIQLIKNKAICIDMMENGISL